MKAVTYQHDVNSFYDNAWMDYFFEVMETHLTVASLQNELPYSTSNSFCSSPTLLPVNIIRPIYPAKFHFINSSVFIITSK